MGGSHLDREHKDSIRTALVSGRGARKKLPGSPSCQPMDPAMLLTRLVLKESTQHYSSNGWFKVQVLGNSSTKDGTAVSSKPQGT
eukprot:1154660-Pelagomonas_calceolata.AAC.1